ncbi:hypothetical protein ECOK1357_0041 [Escherichia coli OK1357]|nr:hypothetical protein ECOK1357_0041 [Escherichia coli OK1357]
MDLMWPFKRKEPSAPAVPDKQPEPQPPEINDEVIASVRQKPRREFVRYEPPPGVIPAPVRDAVLAMDATPYRHPEQSLS